MAIVLFDPELIIARVSGQVAAFKTVSGTADINAADAGLVPIPAAFVLLLSERASPNQIVTLVAQRVVIRFGVALAVQNLRDPRGQKAATDLRTLRLAVMTALYGWQPRPDYDPCEFGGGQLVEFSDQRLWWQDEYLTAFYLKSD